MLVPETIEANMGPWGTFRFRAPRQRRPYHQIVISNIQPSGDLAQQVTMSIFKNRRQVF